MLHNKTCPYCGRQNLSIDSSIAKVERVSGETTLKFYIPFSCICGWSGEEVYLCYYNHTINTKYPARKFDTAKLIKVDSSVIESIGYDKKDSILAIVFKTNPKVYLYKDVDAELFVDFLNSDSKGRFYSEHLRGQFERADA
jgi:hypothetical protein